MHPRALVIALVVIGCGADRAPANPSPVTTPSPSSSSSSSASAALPQGVRGRVIKKTGNFMPGSVGGPPSSGGAVKKAGAPDTTRRTGPLEVPVHVFRGAVAVKTTLDPKDPALVTSVRSDANGEYRVALPPGTYTVVAEIDGKLYLNSFGAGAAAGDAGRWSTVDVAPNAWADWTIEDTSGATF
jgi:hypothetical protein